MKKTKLPRTDSIQELADFWNSHDLTDFTDELEVVTEPVFERAAPIEVHLKSAEAEIVRQLAQAEGVTAEELIRQWVRQRLPRRNGRAAPKKPSTRRGRPSKKPSR